ncbi:hypothetical protein [Rhizobacter sp. Root404]|uniref:hypothetical protein n=1 Tax=Rhizobacter sp. Root404 TaxID=1736528 RepID=UPI0006F84EEA|nr:hypothetical protein [Rhizobacter sp. Root404]KQW36875.1 hypothetical protein ASC76_19905 [Rhizobacter sp. Root404]
MADKIHNVLFVCSTDTEKAAVFMSAAVTLKHRLELMLALPIKSLDAMAIKREITQIGRS